MRSRTDQIRPTGADDPCAGERTGWPCRRWSTSGDGTRDAWPVSGCSVETCASLMASPARSGQRCVLIGQSRLGGIREGGQHAPRSTPRIRGAGGWVGLENPSWPLCPSPTPVVPFGPTRERPLELGSSLPRPWKLCQAASKIDAAAVIHHLWIVLWERQGRWLGEWRTQSTCGGPVSTCCAPRCPTAWPKPGWRRHNPAWRDPPVPRGPSPGGQGAHREPLPALRRGHPHRRGGGAPRDRPGGAHRIGDTEPARQRPLRPPRHPGGGGSHHPTGGERARRPRRGP